MGVSVDECCLVSILLTIPQSSVKQASEVALWDKYFRMMPPASAVGNVLLLKKMNTICIPKIK